MTVAVQDAFGNTVTSATDAVTVAIGTNAGGGVLSGVVTVSAASGVASFSGLSIDKVGTGYTLVATSGALTSATSTAFKITPAAAAQLAFVGQPGGGEPQVIMTPAIQVAIQDAFGNTVTSATDLVGVAIGTNPSGGVLSGTAMLVAAVGGVATFNDLAIHATGDGYTLDAMSGVLVAGSSTPFDIFLDFTQVSIEFSHACGVTTRENAYCWGHDGDGQLGNGAPTAQQSTPALVVGGHKWASVSAGAAHTCGVRARDGAALCWGFADNGRLGNGATTPNQTTPVVVLGGHTFTSVSAGSAHTCGVRATDGAALCWGLASFGQLGNGATIPDQTSPVVVLGGHTFGSVSVGNDHTCGVRTDGQGLCWGFGGSGQLGNNSTVTQLSPVFVSNFIRFASVNAGNGHTCGVTTGGGAFCWGFGGSGQLGNGSTAQSNVPVLVIGALDFFSVSAGTNGGTCGAATSGAYCWGFNSSAQLGNGTTLRSAIPIRVSGSR